MKGEKPGSKGVKLDVLAWLGRATLDVIGLAGTNKANFQTGLLMDVRCSLGFGYSFDSLTGESNALAEAFAAIFATASTFRYMIILATWFPILRRFVSLFRYPGFCWSYNL